MRLLRSAPDRFTRRLLNLILRPSPARRGVLVVTRTDLFPPDHGAAVRTDRTASGISRLNGPVFVVTDDRRRYHRYLNGDAEERWYPWWLQHVGPWRRLILRRLRAAGVPANDCFLYGALLDWSIRLRAAYIASRHGLRTCQAEFPAYAKVCAWVSSLLGGSSLLVEHNVEYERLTEQLPPTATDARAFLREVEIDLCNRVDAVVTVSSRDLDSLSEAGVAANKLNTIPHGVDIGAFDRAEPCTAKLRSLGIPPDRPILVYHGTYLYPPNVAAIKVLATEILPGLRANGIHAVVLAVGPHPPPGFADPNVFFTGSVESVAPYIRSAQVAVMPLQQGAGTRMKVMDYFAGRVPVVSTSKGVEGLGLVDGRELYVRDDWPGFVRAVARIIADSKTAESLAQEARCHVECLDWSHVARRYLDLYARLRQP